jgi:hypothetical protein
MVKLRPPLRRFALVRTAFDPSPRLVSGYASGGGPLPSRSPLSLMLSVPGYDAFWSAGLELTSVHQGAGSGPSPGGCTRLSPM